MATWADFYPDMMPHLPECPVEIISHELKRAAQTFFDRTRAWRITENAVAVAGGTETVSAAPSDSGQELVRVEQAWFDGKVLDPFTAEGVLRDFGEDWMEQTGVPIAYIQDTPGEIRLFPIPESAATVGIILRISVRPNESSTGIPDEFYAKYRDVIASGAKSRLMLYPKKAWTDFELGRVMAEAFSTGVNTATASAARSFGRARIPSQPHWC